MHFHLYCYRSPFAVAVWAEALSLFPFSLEFAVFSGFVFSVHYLGQGSSLIEIFLSGRWRKVAGRLGGHWKKLPMATKRNLKERFCYFWLFSCLHLQMKPKKRPWKSPFCIFQFSCIFGANFPQSVQSTAVRPTFRLNFAIQRHLSFTGRKLEGKFSRIWDAGCSQHTNLRPLHEMTHRQKIFFHSISIWMQFQRHYQTRNRCRHSSKWRCTRSLHAVSCRVGCRSHFCFLRMRNRMTNTKWNASAVLLECDPLGTFLLHGCGLIAFSHSVMAWWRSFVQFLSGFRFCDQREFAKWSCRGVLIEFWSTPQKINFGAVLRLKAWTEWTLGSKFDFGSFFCLLGSSCGFHCFR